MTPLALEGPTMSASSWQDAEVARRFLDERRAAIPYAADHLDLIVRLVRHFRGEPVRLLDRGCGDGILARTILLAFPGSRAVLLDHSAPMLQRAREAMAPFADRCDIVEGELAQPLTWQVAPPFDLVVSGFAIHHLESPRKRSLYEEIFALLSPGGLFVHLEHVASATPRGEALFDELYIDHIAARTGRDRGIVENEYHARPDRADNKLEPVEVQLHWLREIGFVEVDCFFKWMALAIFAGQRLTE
jgi:tRNA (cmo5U34)-methyltransferase